MRLLVLGAGGQLGRDVVRAALAAGESVIGLTHRECDVTDRAAVQAAFESEHPDAVVNCAAWTRVDAAEDHETEAAAINATGAGNVAEVAGAGGAALCHVSTDYVFDGTSSTPIAEDAPPQPISAYGRTKLAGEEAVRAAMGERALIVRTAWVYGAYGPNFVLTMLRLARDRGSLRVVADQTGTPTWTGHLAPALLRLLHRHEIGTLHLTNSGETTWHGFAQAIVEDSGLSDVPVEAITTAEYPTPARRPAYSVLDNGRWRDLGEAPLPNWRDGLRTYLRELTPQKTR